ncbi:phosphopantetheinyl transferase [Flavobacterium sp. Root901]|uniref:4'-phosphopantetheinyl transferase family protein n=1 Tax=Flavobacterium sp. Root901 TaxID=1736605 RepID=UPI00070B82DC|nr:4'-phosphopantetheinyl transferase superfamily protein [Flavobacterium sp. Root901]KRD05102.1 phosphopantetheinyl transferase [Flavobacterium sp. Root901]
MIGNDVIDLRQSLIESNWRRRGFIEKLFTDAEQRLINNYHDPEIMLWILWSMKEAAYKIYHRQIQIRAYIPKKLSCSIITLDKGIAKGIVICSENKYYTKTLIDTEKIHTTAVLNPENLNRIIEIEKKGIVKNENGVPYLAVFSNNTLKDISISHHGRFEHMVTIKEN